MPFSLPEEAPPSAPSPDTLRTVTLTAGGRPVQRLNLEDSTTATWYKARGTFKVLPPAKTPTWVKGVRRMTGQIQSGESQDNWAVLATWWVKGTTANEVMQNVERLLAEIDDPTGLTPYQPRLIEWRPASMTYSTFYELRGTGSYQPTYEWAIFSGSTMMKVDLTWPVAPLGSGLPLDITDPFLEDSRSDYTTDKGALGYGVNALTFTAAEQQARHTSRGYSYDDAETTAQYTIPVGATAPEYLAATVCCINATTYLEVRWTSTEHLEIIKVVSGVPTQLATIATTGKKPTAGNVVWVRARTEGNFIVGECFLTTPGPAATPLFSVSFPMTVVESLVFGEGHRGTGGFHLKPLDANVILESFQVLPYTFKARAQPDVRTLRGIPGSAPASMDVMVTTPILAAAATWAVIGWTRKPLPWNMLTNGHFTADLTDWVLTGKPPVASPHLPPLDASYGVAPEEAIQVVSGFNFSTPNPLFPSGSPYMRLKVKTTGGEGANQVPLSMRFRKGTPYTFSVWVFMEGAAGKARAWLGARGNNADSVRAETTTVGAITQLTGVWIPKADTDTATFSVTVTNASVAGTLRVAQGEVYEGTIAPSGPTQESGRGALPPFGPIQAEESNVANNSNVLFSTGLEFNGTNSITATAEPFEGSGLMYATNEGGVLVTGTAGGLNGGGSSQLAWWIDPSLMVTPDDYARGSISIEVFWRGFCSGSGPIGASYITAPRLLLWALPEPVATNEGYRYTNEYQSTGHSLAQLAAVTGSYNGLRPARLGTIELPVDPLSPVRWLLVLDMIWSAAVLGLFATDSLLLVPANRRAFLPTGKPRSDGYYPTFNALSATYEAQKIVKANLRGQNRQVLAGGLSGANAGSGMSGSPMDELPIGTSGSTDLAVVTALSSLVPDDPSGEQGDLLQPLATTHFAITPRYRLARGQ